MKFIVAKNKFLRKRGNQQTEGLTNVGSHEVLKKVEEFQLSPQSSVRNENPVSSPGDNKPEKTQKSKFDQGKVTKKIPIENIEEEFKNKDSFNDSISGNQSFTDSD